MEDEERERPPPPPSTESRSICTRNVVEKRTLPSSLTASDIHGRARASRSTSPCAASMSMFVNKGLEVPEEEEDEEDNSFDRNDELSVSLPSVDGGSHGEDVVEVSNANVVEMSKAKRGGKKAEGWHFIVAFQV